MQIDACVRCGFCCSQSPCPFGKLADVGIGCAFLQYDDDHLATCTRYDKIVKDPSQVFSPAFGYGCCANLNTYRREIILAKYKGVSPQIEIEEF